jgi:serine protease Do
MNKTYIKIIFLAFSLFLFAQADIANSRRNAFTNAIEIASPAVVSMNVTQLTLKRFPIPYVDEVESSGSGVIISPDGYVLTNDHVVEYAEKIIVTLPGGEEFNADVVGSDALTDLALLKLDGNNFPYIEMANSDELIIGEWVIALGNPFGLFNVNQQPIATIGIVSGKDLDFGLQEGKVFQGMIQTDAAINPGNSGGPLVNSLGELIGINTFIYTGSNSSQGSVGIGFAVPINRAKAIAEELKRYGTINRQTYFGIEGIQLYPKLSSYYNLPLNEGVYILRVVKNSPAYNAKLATDDIIVSVQNQKILNLKDINNIIKINDLRPGDKITIRVFRDGKYIIRKLKLGKI